MLLQHIELCNFRAFFGIHRIDFASEVGKAVTLFHGENGAGKTNLLNAIHWCLANSFTPRFQDQRLLLNKAAARLGEKEIYVELTFMDAGNQYRARRSYRNGASPLDLFIVKNGNSTLLANGEAVLQRILPSGLVSWFFFDAEAIGTLELSGSDEFRHGLRRTLGFELVDRLIKDLEDCKNKRQREVATETNSTELNTIQEQIDNIARVLPKHHAHRTELESQIKSARAALSKLIERQAALPAAKDLTEKRQQLESKLARAQEERIGIERQVATIVGAGAAPVFIRDMALTYEHNLQVQEIEGRLPSPYSDQLVKEIIGKKECICGRPVHPQSQEADCIVGLLKFANTSELNRRIKEVQYLIRTIEDNSNGYASRVMEARNRLTNVDRRIGEYEEELRTIKAKLEGINHEEIQALERERDLLIGRLSDLNEEKGRYEEKIRDMEANTNDLQARYERAAKRVAVGAKLRKELDKISRLLIFIRNTLKDQEKRALLILNYELNTILKKYLVKHYQARIDPTTYAVQLLDEQGQQVGHSTGEGQILKFAFISTVVALAAKKTQEKVEWMADPTIAPLVLDAPFSALDPEYQGSVARNLAAQTTQLVLMISSAGWGEKVSEALEPFVGKRYLIVSKTSGSQGDKPVKTMTISGKEHLLNEYDAPQDEAVFVEVK
jgi:DNA sulfur modification protein DndD